MIYRSLADAIAAASATKAKGQHFSEVYATAGRAK